MIKRMPYLAPTFPGTMKGMGKKCSREAKYFAGIFYALPGFIGIFKLPA